jgi:K+-sensing histidine kinase KdpD
LAFRADVAFTKLKVLDSSASRPSGVGLGLAIAKRAIRVHDCNICAENADSGLRVSFDLPAKA